jgi:hypothetical protein
VHALTTLISADSYGDIVPSLRFSTAVSHEVVTGAIPVLKLWSGLDLTGIDRQQSGYVVFDRRASLQLGGLWAAQPRFMAAPSVGQSFGNDTGLSVELQFDLPRYWLDAVESRRADDINGTLNVGLILVRQGGSPEDVGASVPVKLSEKEWTEVLSRAEYRAGWTLHVDRGRVEGWDEVARLLSEAHDRMLSRDTTAVLVACRGAIRAAEKVVSADWKEIALQIDRGSTPETGYKIKSERVEKLREWILLMADTGAHTENYNATSEDAQFVYGLTCDLLAYLSRKELHAERARRP